jgi:hypothetical protein
MKTHHALSAAIVALALPAVALATDTSTLGATVQQMSIDQQIPPGNLSLKNVSTSKIASRRDLRSFGDNPRFRVIGKAFCKPGARLTAVQAIIGKVVLNQTEVFPTQVFGQSAKDTTVAGLPSTLVDIPVTLNVARRDNGSLVDLRFNPSRTYEQKLKAFVAKGNTAAEFLRETQAFDMDVTVNLIVWCKMDAGAQSVLAGKTYPGMISRKVPVTILYNGDPTIIDGPSPRLKASTRKATGGPPAHNR